VLDLMLSQDFPGAGSLRPQVPYAQVVGGCDCGCATVDFEVAPEAPRASPDLRGRVLPVTGYVGADIDQPGAGIIVFVDEGFLSRLEIYSMAEPAPHEWPDLAEIQAFNNSEARAAHLPAAMYWGTRGQSVAQRFVSKNVESPVTMGTKKEEGSMSRLLVRNFSVSLDGYAAGPLQDLDHPLGTGACISTNGSLPRAAAGR